MFLARLPSLQRPEGLTKEALHVSLPNPLWFYSPAKKQLFLSQLQPGLPQEDAADHS